MSADRLTDLYFVIAEVLMGRPTMVGTEAEEIFHTVVEGTRAIDSERHHLRILQETTTGNPVINTTTNNNNDVPTIRLYL